ncbi:MAG TPA: pseudouridine synthase [Terriglobales bacterium]|nr:pseudouridine synthase [Terriglobales bacterium]
MTKQRERGKAMPPLGTRGLAGSAISLKFKSRNHTSRSRGSILEEMKWGSDRRVGLARALSKMGYCSRSRAFELAREGRVRVNGEARRDPESAVRMEKDRITVDGRAVEVGKRIYLMLNKERGVLTTASDEKGRATVYAYLSDRRPWVAPVGRLDKASEGLLLLTNDSEWAARVLRPEMHLEKTYHVQIGTVAKAALLEALRDGIEVDGQWLRAKRARVLRGGAKNTWLEIVLDEGKNRQIRRMLAAWQVEVLRLVRVAIGRVELGGLKKGQVRELTEREKWLLGVIPPNS